MKSLSIAWRLLWANRWLWLLLVLSPWGMAAVLLAGGGHPAEEDIQAAFAQEAIYGLALVAFTGGSLLGNEQRSRRIAMVMSRAVSRRQYLGALWLAAFMPLLVYAADLALTGPLLGATARTLAEMLGALLLLGAELASLAVLASLALPGVVAGMASLAVLCLPLTLSPNWQIAETRMLQILLSGVPSSQVGLMLGAGAVETLVLAAALFEAAVRIFGRQDLRLKSE